MVWRTADGDALVAAVAWFTGYLVLFELSPALPSVWVVALLPPLWVLVMLVARIYGQRFL